jgi:hypothetical protein
MEKPADNTYPIHDLFKRRWSPRAFAERPVEHEKLRSLFDYPPRKCAIKRLLISAAEQGKSGTLAFPGLITT